MSFANFVKKSKFLTNVFTSLGKVYPDISGYRRIGLKYDDLISEENDVVKEALRRLPVNVADARTLRLRQAFQLSVAHAELPKKKWTTPEEDSPYLMPIIKEVEAEFAEKEEFDTLKSR
ncbi:Cytochrome b-c1 complex subunit 7 [Entomophthora muscae]|uniref:Cytochrome b-c1 complex subunit 7 n=1 Tax=Entomophthora muscae TaxID=34485 RepID=A0ACC2RQE1_9FUNG|nr:Cytochrome b-c1 complex subunit 7 [Entomophthora muscae]